MAEGMILRDDKVTKAEAASGVCVSCGSGLPGGPVFEVSPMQEQALLGSDYTSVSNAKCSLKELNTVHFQLREN